MTAVFQLSQVELQERRLQRGPSYRSCTGGASAPSSRHPRRALYGVSHAQNGEGLGAGQAPHRSSRRRCWTACPTTRCGPLRPRAGPATRRPSVQATRRAREPAPAQVTRRVEREAGPATPCPAAAVPGDRPAAPAPPLASREHTRARDGQCAQCVSPRQARDERRRSPVGRARWAGQGRGEVGGGGRERRRVDVLQRRRAGRAPRTGRTRRAHAHHHMRHRGHVFEWQSRTAASHVAERRR